MKSADDGKLRPPWQIIGRGAFLPIATVALLVDLGIGAHASTTDVPGGPATVCDWNTAICQPSATEGGSGGSTRPAKDGSSATTGGAASSGQGSVPDPRSSPDDLLLNCVSARVDPQPPKSDPIWAGNTDGVIMLRTCRHTDEGFQGIITTQYWAATVDDDPPGVPTVTPKQLAQQALAELRVPRPQVHRSPPETATWQGDPYTWIKMPTWFWTSTGWKPLSKTARLGAVWATVTVTPHALVVDGGDGGKQTRCDGPGVPYSATASSSDQVTTAAKDLPAGACTYVYSSVKKSVIPKVSITWSVSWQGSGGSGAQLPQMTTTTAEDPMAVLQIETVIK